MNATMIIECPNCGTKYKVIPEAIKPRGRTVHCTTCSNKWHVEAAQAHSADWEERLSTGSFDEDSSIGAGDSVVEEALPHEELEHEDLAETHEPDPDAPPVEAMAHEPAPFMAASPKIASEPDRGHASGRASLMLVAVTLLALMGGAYGLRAQIQRAWPASGRLYQAVGLTAGTTPGQGLQLQDVHAYLVQNGAAQTLNIEAKVVNPLKTPVLLPNLDASLVGTSGAVQHWTVPGGAGRLEPGASTIVKASFDGANTENGKILLTFSADNSAESK